MLPCHEGKYAIDIQQDPIIVRGLWHLDSYRREIPKGVALLLLFSNFTSLFANVEYVFKLGSFQVISTFATFFKFKDILTTFTILSQLF